MGTVLSGGQKQRVLLARALYRRTGILMLGEATSHLDVERERAVNQALRATHMTRIVIAHRPETIRASARVAGMLGLLATGRGILRSVRQFPIFRPSSFRPDDLALPRPARLTDELPPKSRAHRLPASSSCTALTNVKEIVIYDEGNSEMVQWPEGLWIH
jgi:ABC-type nitrate/sulfonate/bicarbonate transport system ATPase subunit